MKQNGIYSILIAFFALTLISSGILSTKTVQSLNDGPSAGKITNVLTGWQNMRYLLDKTTSDAIYDTIATSSSCAMPSQTEIEAKINSYYSQIVGTFKNPTCSISNSSTSVAGNDVTATLDLECKIETAQMTATLKDSVFLKKNVSISTGNPVKITDADSGVDEISQTISACTTTTPSGST